MKKNRRKLLCIIGIAVMWLLLVFRLTDVEVRKIFALPCEKISIPDYDDLWVLGSGLESNDGYWLVPENGEKYSLRCVYKWFKVVRYEIEIIEYTDECNVPDSLVVGDSILLQEKNKDLKYRYKSSNGKVLLTIGNRLTVVGSGECTITKIVNNTQYYTYDIHIEKPELKAASLYKNEELKLELSNTSIKGIGWTSENEDILSVSQEGIIRGIKTGKTKVSVKVGNDILSQMVTVSKDPEINKEKLRVNCGTTKQLKIKNAIDDISWTSLGKNVATIDEKGVVTAVDYGTAVIMGIVRNKVVRCKVTVPVPKFEQESYTTSYGTPLVVGLKYYSKGDIEWSVEGESVMLGDTTDEKIQKKLQEEFVEKELTVAKEITDYVRVNGFSYGNAARNPAMGSVDKLVSCDRFVGWVLYNLGYTNQPVNTGLTVKNPNPYHDLPTFCENHGFTRINSLEECRAGDIMFQGFSTGNYHTYILGYQSSNGLWQRYDCGHDSRIQSVQPSVENKSIGFSFAYRPKALISATPVICKDNQVVLTGVKKGTSKLIAKIGDEEITVEITVN